MRAVIASAMPHATSIDQDLLAHGVSPDKWWAANESSNGAVLREYIECHKQTVSNRRFNLTVHRRIVLQKLDAYHRKLRSEMPEVLL